MGGGACGVRPPSRVVVENHRGETDAVLMASFGCVVERPPECLVWSESRSSRAGFLDTGGGAGGDCKVTKLLVLCLSRVNPHIGGVVEAGALGGWTPRASKKVFAKAFIRPHLIWISTLHS